MKKNNNKGFTLAELLIVVAIIAVLTAIAIPVFTTQLEKSREATDLSNIRALYAEVVAAGLTDPANAHSGSITEKQQVSGWATDSATTIAGVPINSISAANGAKVTVAWHPASGTKDAYVTIGSASAVINNGVS